MYGGVNFMDKTITRKVKGATNWKMMSVEDKILLVMEFICYFLILCTSIAIIFTVKKGFNEGTVALIFSIAGFAGCALNARSSRDIYISEWEFEPKTNAKRVKKSLKLN